MKGLKGIIKKIFIAVLIVMVCITAKDFLPEHPRQNSSASFYGLKQFHIEAQHEKPIARHNKFWGVPTL